MNQSVLQRREIMECCIATHSFHPCHIPSLFTLILLVSPVLALQANTYRKGLFLTVFVKHHAGQIWIFFLCMSCVHTKVFWHIFTWCVSTRKARRAVKCGFMCPFSDRCLEGDRGLRRHQTTSVCCLCRCSSTTGFDYLLLLECEIWICFSITQSLVCGGAGRSEADSKCVRPSWAEFVLVIASSRGLNVCAFRQEAGRKRHFPLYFYCADRL